MEIKTKNKSFYLDFLTRREFPLMELDINE